MTRCLLSILLVAAAASPAFGQQPLGAIRGIVRDASGTALPAAAATLHNRETNVARSAETAADGEFVLAAVPPGFYRLELAVPGFKTHVEEFELFVNQDLRIDDVILQVGAASERVLVTGSGLALDRDSAALGAVVDNRQVVGLPLDGRNVLELTLLSPGTAPAAQGSASSVRGDFAFTVAGGREDANGFLLDGVDNVDPKLNTPAVRPPVDAIREFQVQTSSYEAATGRYGAGQVSVVSHSGTNALRGTAYEFFRNGALDATNVFAPRDAPAPDYRRNQFGASIGGPLAKDRMFFFADYEGTRITEGITQVTNVPTAAERSGDFSQSLLPAPRDVFTGQPFPDNRIPAFYLNPIGQAIANLYPLPNRDVPLANYVSSPNLEDRNDHFDVRVDRAAGGRLDLMARYSFSDRTLLEPFAGTAFSQLPGFGNTLERRAQNVALGGVSMLSSRLLNEARFGYTRVAGGVIQEGQGTSLNRQVGLPELSPNPRDWGLSFITVTGFSPLGQEYNNPQHSVTDAFQFSDTLTWSPGRHLLKAGMDFRAVRQEAFRDVQARGNIAFTPFAYTGNALGDLLLGLPSLTVGARLDNPQRLRTENVGLFVQDSWRVAANLTLTGGLRYELTSPPVDVDDRANLYDPEQGQLVRVGTGGLPRAGYAADRNNVAPRAGFAWTLDDSTVVRGAYGLYYNQAALAPSEGLYFSDPYFHLDFFLPAAGLPPLTLYDPFPANYPFPSPQSGFTIQRDLETPYLQHWSLGVQRQVGATRTIEVAYVGSRGRQLTAARDINQPRPSPQPLNLRPNPLFGDITAIESAGRSAYNSLQLQFEQRSARGLTLLAGYTLGKSEDDASGFFPSAGDPNYPQDSLNRAAEYGRSSFDVRHRFSLGFAWALPYDASGGTVLDALLADWQVSGVVTLQSGRPFTVALLSEIDNSNTGRSNLGFGANDRPHVVGDPQIDDPSPERWFNTSAFAFPAFGTFGNAGRNTVEGPGYQNVNLALMKMVPLGRARLQLRAEAFNLFNRVNFNQPDNFVGSPTFGRILSAQSPRRIQLGVKALF
jgi:TonB dependent receptor/Carboxypeptidase regulatory-like domain